MVYQGSKARLLKDILPFIQNCIDGNNIKTYCEPFVGGANVIASVKAENRQGCDNNPALITLLRYMQNFPEMKDFPETCPVEHYKEVRSDYRQNGNNFPEFYKAGIGYFASYGGRFFDGGYGRDKTGKRDIYADRLANARKQAPLLSGISFNTMSYEDISIFNEVPEMFYCDPPYKGTKVYNGKNNFDYWCFYDWLRQLSQKHFVLISEFQMPDDFVCIWSKERLVGQKSDRTKGDRVCEKLFTLKGGLYDSWYKENK